MSGGCWGDSLEEDNSDLIALKSSQQSITFTATCCCLRMMAVGSHEWVAFIVIDTSLVILLSLLPP